MAKKLYGTDPDQVPTNADLGTMAYQDRDYLDVGEVHSDNQTIVSTKSTNALSVTTNASSNVALSIGGSSTINGVTSSAQSFYIMNVARDSGSGKSTYFNGNIGFPDGYGIDFSASEGSGASSSLLDDYEEGEHVVTMTGSTSGTATLNSALNTITYRKIGSVVHVQGRVQLSSVNGASGRVRISLPFSAASLTDDGTALLTALVYGGNKIDSGEGTIIWEIFESQNVANLYYFDGVSVDGVNFTTHVDDDTVVGISGSYIAT